MSSLPSNPSTAFKLRNPHLYGKSPPSTPGKMLRQSSKPRLNKTESQFRAWLETSTTGVITEQAITFQLANGVRYTPDFVVFYPTVGTMFCFEVKSERRDDSRWATDDFRVKIKVAAQQYPWIKWVVAWKEGGEWKTQTVMI